MRSVLALGLVAVLSIAASAQLPTSTVNGTVTDPQGATVVGARVSVTSSATGVSREAVTDTGGRYAVPGLPPGDYLVRVSASGFGTSVIKDLHLDVGRAVTLDVPLKVAKTGEVITVTGEEAGVTRTQSEVQGQILAGTIENIPLNGRNFLELAFLLPGNRPGTNYDPTKTNTLEVSSAGGFGRGGNITVDGGDNNDEVVGGTLANFPQDGVAEFQIATNRYTAEVGRSGSSIINIVTKSGTNDYHGSLFFFFRHKVLQGLPATFSRSQPTPPFDREQYGGSIGGPIKKERAWWFLSAEDRTQRNGVQVAERDFTLNQIVQSSASGNLQDFLLTSRVDFKATEHDNIAVRYSFNRNTQLDAASLRRPIGTLAQRQDSLNRFNSILANWTRILSSQQVNELVFHIDYFINNIPAFGGTPATNCVGVSGNCNLAMGNEIRFPDLQDGESFRIPQRTRLNRYQLKDNFSWVLGEHTLRFGGEWQNYGSDIFFDLFGSGRIDVTEDFPTADRNGDGVIDDRDIPIAFTIKNAAPVSPAAPFYRNNYFGFYAQDDWRVRSNLTFNLGLRWEFDADVLGDGPFSRPCADPTVLTTTAGCLWVKSALGPHDTPGYKNFAPRVGFAWDPFSRGNTVVRGGYGIYYDRVVLEVPLLEVLLDGRVVQLGVHNGSTIVGGLFAPDSVTGQVVSLQDPGPPNFGGPFAGGPIPVGIGINHIDTHARTPIYQQFTFGVQQQIRNNWVLSADVVHDFGYHLLIGRFLRSGTSRNPNITLSCPDNITPCTITDPATGISDNITNIESSAKFWYDGLLTSLQKRPTGKGSWKWGFNASYTLSKTFNYSNDDQIPFNGAEDQVNLVLHVNNLRLEKGYSSTDERHRFVFSGVFEMPWQVSVSPIWTIASHVPIDSFVPLLSSRLPTIRRNGLGREIQSGAQLNAAIDACNAAGFCVDSSSGTPVPLGHVDPGMRFGDDFNSLDLRFTKTFKFTERQNLQFITEVFNVFNITNIRGFNNNNFSGFNNALVNDQNDPTRIASGFNTPIRTAGGFFGSGGPRAFQFALRYSF
jgi:hypothetical protein